MSAPDPTKPRLLVLSHVLPFPGETGQQQRVAYTLRAAAAAFHVTFLTVAQSGTEERVRRKLADFCDEGVVWRSLSSGGPLARARCRLQGAIYSARTGLKRSNYVIGKIEFPPHRLDAFLRTRRFDCALFEYWHAADSAAVLRAKDIPAVVDLHNVLWQSFKMQLQRRRLPGVVRGWALERYKRQEEQAWNQFDGLIAINREERDYVRKVISGDRTVFFSGMGIDLGLWPYCAEAARPPRIAYYGGLGSVHNQAAALQCYTRVMPLIWEKVPDAEFWIIGSNPPESLRRLTSDTRVKITGFVADVPSVLRHATVVVCAWAGTYGFRSRVVEAMALGVPVVATPQAVYGMDIEPGRGLLLGTTDEEMAAYILRLLLDRQYAAAQRHESRRQIEVLYSFENTYAKLIAELREWVDGRRMPALGNLLDPANAQ